MGRCESDATLLCDSYLPASVTTSATGRSTRLVYSFGIANQWTFEDWKYTWNRTNPHGCHTGIGGRSALLFCRYVGGLQVAGDLPVFD